MTDVLTTAHIASVSLADADKDPEGFAQELGNSFVDYGFAVVRDHGIHQRGRVLPHHRDRGVDVAARDGVALLRHRAA